MHSLPTLKIRALAFSTLWLAHLPMRRATVWPLACLLLIVVIGGSAIGTPLIKASANGSQGVPDSTSLRSMVAAPASNAMTHTVLPLDEDAAAASDDSDTGMDDNTIPPPPPLDIHRYVKDYTITVTADTGQHIFSVQEQLKLDNGESVDVPSDIDNIHPFDITVLRERVSTRLAAIRVGGSDPTVDVTLPNGTQLFGALCADQCPSVTVKLRQVPWSSFVEAADTKSDPKPDGIMNEIRWTPNESGLTTGIIFDIVPEWVAALRPPINPLISIKSVPDLLTFVVSMIAVFITGLAGKTLVDFASRIITLHRSKS